MQLTVYCFIIKYINTYKKNNMTPAPPKKKKKKKKNPTKTKPTPKNRKKTPKVLFVDIKVKFCNLV